MIAPAGQTRRYPALDVGVGIYTECKYPKATRRVLEVLPMTESKGNRFTKYFPLLARCPPIDVPDSYATSGSPRLD